MRAATIALATGGILASALPLPAMAEDSVKVGGKAFIRTYTYDMTEAGKKVNNEMALDRVYLTAEAKLWESGKAKIVLEGGDLREDAYSLSGTTLGASKSYFDVATKVAMLIVDDLPFGTYAQFGQIDLPWVPYEEGLWGYRVEGTIFEDRAGYLTSTDLGAAIGGKYDMATWQLNVANGEGWKAPEAGYHKDLHGRVTLYPLAPLGMKEVIVAGGATLGNYDPDTSPLGDGLATFNKMRYIGQVGYVSKGNVTLVGDYVMTQDPASKLTKRYPSLADASLKDQLASGAGFTAFAVLNLGLYGAVPALKPLDLFARYDSIDPDSVLADNGMTRAIGGLSVTWNKHVKTLLGYDATSLGSAFNKADGKDVASKVNAEQRVILTSEVAF